MKIIETGQLAAILNPLGFEIGAWGQIAPILNGEQVAEYKYICYQSPLDAKEMLSFAQHVVAWVFGGDWMIFKSDYSTVFDMSDRCLIGQFLGIRSTEEPIKEDIALLLSSTLQNSAITSIELECSFLIYLFLLVSGHAQIVSSKNIDGRYISIQDGFIYLFTKGKLEDGNNLLRKFEENKLAPATWLAQLICEK